MPVCPHLSRCLRRGPLNKLTTAVYPSIKIWTLAQEHQVQPLELSAQVKVLQMSPDWLCGSGPTVLFYSATARTFWRTSFTVPPEYMLPRDSFPLRSCISSTDREHRGQGLLALHCHCQKNQHVPESNRPEGNSILVRIIQEVIEDPVLMFLNLALPLGRVHHQGHRSVVVGKEA